MARSEAPHDPRPYIRVSTDLPLHPKLAALDDPAAGWTYVVSLCYCGQSLTDGHFPTAAVLRMAGTDKAIAEALVEQGLWHLPGHDCGECEQPRQGHAIVHDYLQHQRSSAEVRELTEKRRAAGRRGAESRWGNRAESMASAMASAKQVPWQMDGKPMAEERRGEEIKKKTSSSSLGANKSRATRVPDDFAITPEMAEWGKKNAPDVHGVRETERFVDYWRAQPGQRGVKVDWVATWRNWMRRAQDAAKTSNVIAMPSGGRSSLPPSNAPVAIPPEERCPDHRGETKDHCRWCRALAIGRPQEIS